MWNARNRHLRKLPPHLRETGSRRRPPVLESLENRTLLSTGSFTHPGLLETDADFARMRDKANAGAHPWIDSWNRLIANPHAQLSWNPSPVTELIRGSTTDGPENYWRAYNDTAAAYQLGLRWKNHR
jgi:hypothetical protein